MIYSDFRAFTRIRIWFEEQIIIDIFTKCIFCGTNGSRGEHETQKENLDIMINWEWKRMQSDGEQQRTGIITPFLIVFVEFIVCKSQDWKLLNISQLLFLFPFRTISRISVQKKLALISIFPYRIPKGIDHNFRIFFTIYRFLRAQPSHDIRQRNLVNDE